MKPLFWQAAKCSTKEEFARIIKTIKDVSVDAHTWLMNRDPHLWSRAFFDTKSNCTNVENNMSEAFNGYINEAREKPIIQMLEDIRIGLMIRVEKKLKEIAKDPHDPICPRVRKILEENKLQYRFWNCSHNSDRKFEVKLGDVGYIVDMSSLTCSCRMWQLSGIPCCHAINAIYFLCDSPNKYVAKWYFKDTYMKTYRPYLEPMNGENMWPISTIEPVLPPERRRLPGRPKKQRRREHHEDPRPSVQVSRKGKEIKCTRCQQAGHNRLTCKNEQVEVMKDPPKPRGRPKKPVTVVAATSTKRPRGTNKKQKKHSNMGFGVYTCPRIGNTYLN